MPGKSTAQTEANYNGVEKAQQAANNTVALSRKQKKEQNRIKNQKYANNRKTAKSARVQKAIGEIEIDPTPAKTKIDFNSEKPSPKIDMSSSSPEVEPAYDTNTGKAQSPESKVSTKQGGLLDAMKQDGATTKGYLSDVAGILSGEKEAAEIVSTGKAKTDSLKTRSGKYLEDMGGGSKTLGGAKVAGYMLGAAMLTDMLNPFDDD